MIKESAKVFTNTFSSQTPFKDGETEAQKG